MGSSRVWQWRQALAKSALHGTTKNVLRTLSEFMNKDGGSCYPSIKILAERSSLQRKTVRKHLRIAVWKGWIEISSAEFRGRAWRRQQYQACFPESTDDLGRSTTQKLRKPLAGVGHLAASGGVSDAFGVGYEVPRVITSPKELLTNSPTPDAGQDGRRAVEAMGAERENLFNRFREKHPTSAFESCSKMMIAFDACTPEQQRVGVERHGDWLRQLKGLGRDFVPNGGTYWQERLWEGLPPPTTPHAQASETLHASPWSREWWAAILSAAGQGDDRRVSYISMMLRDHGRGVQLDLSSARDQSVLALSECLDKVGAGDRRMMAAGKWFADRTVRPLPEIPLNVDHCFVPTKRGWEILAGSEVSADTRV
ncbi:helix-turn-helix domain-containing protein [Tepidamorphus sp. 3E244]|uniref:helix-turn-helix domain-containing protein n=1 Tax=Tepidamorphus sp. 3E244 TaxID=3385498 RepID=UPI0038FC28A3